MIEYCNKFLAEMEALKLYLVEFEEDSLMKSKTYPNDCTIGGSEKQLIILITHNESTFNANDSCQQVWQKESHSTLCSKGKGKRIMVSNSTLCPKGKGKRIMVSNFLLPWSQLNLHSLSDQAQHELASSGVLLEAVEFFEYGKIMCQDSSLT